MHKNASYSLVPLHVWIGEPPSHVERGTPRVGREGESPPHTLSPSASRLPPPHQEILKPPLIHMICLHDIVQDRDELLTLPVRFT